MMRLLSLRWSSRRLQQFRDDSPHGTSRGLLGAEHHALSSQSDVKNVERGIMVPIADHTALLARIKSHRQWHLLSMPAIITCLCGVGRGHFDHVSLSCLKAMGTKGQRSQFVSVILAYVKQFCVQCFIRGKGCHMFLKLYCDVSLWLLRSQIGENFFEETVRLSRCNTPGPAWALLTPTCAVGIIRDMTPKCTMKPIYQLFDGGKLGTLLREGDALAAQRIGVFPLLQCGVVQLRAEGELLIQQAFLLLCRVETVLIGFLHT